MAKLNVDCLSLIFNELQEDKNSLYSCLLVNKEWCNVVVPILWKNHSEEELEKKQKKFFSTILSCLPSTSKKLLFDNDIKLPSTILLKPTLFNYISFCKFPKAFSIRKNINMMFAEINSIKSISYNLIEQEIYKLFVIQCKGIKELWWETSQPLSLFPGASTCFSQLCNLYVDIDFVNSNVLYEMARICKDLNELTINNCYQDLPGLISLINVQRNLKSVDIYNDENETNETGTCKELGEALKRKGNTINYFLSESISIIPPSFLTSLTNLKRITIYNGEEYEEDNEKVKEFQRCLAISEFPDLEYLIIDKLSCFKELAMLIEKTKGNILEVDVFAFDNQARNTEMLIKAISINCPKIKRLETYLKPEDFIHIKLLLLNCRCLENIRFDSLDYDVNENEDIGDKLLDILIKFSPNSLVKIGLSGDWKYSVDAFERFFESCRERTLHYFGITYDDEKFITKDHKIIIRKYIKEKVIKDSYLL